MLAKNSQALRLFRKHALSLTFFASQLAPTVGVALGLACEGNVFVAVLVLSQASQFPHLSFVALSIAVGSHMAETT
ncbi:hypothetical protein HFD98_20975 [Pseudomonas sp. EKM23D]|uniref:hypothetical protein n=1 Tax=Pseudomonas TaxID=286 RepID=UPI00142DDC59|nr:MULTISPECIES: hypothetical protein [Pseudomonas]KAF6688002.1 hypothetical protein HFD98_20975 [Pseudomonas sp. EKM23D]QKJ71344.1 hypothetical protein HRH33_01770 [Pseudomonas rhodesiae]